MRTIRIGSVACMLAIVALVSVAPSHAQPAPQTTQAALIKEAGILSDKFSGLARVMAGKYDWKPGEGVRSVGDVFNLIVKENGILAGTLTGADGGRGGAPITDPEKMQAALKTSYANLQKTIEGLSDSDLKAPVKLFGKEAATHRFTLDEKKAIANIVYTYKLRDMKTSENEITRIALNYLIDEYRRNSTSSILAQVLARLNQ